MASINLSLTLMVALLSGLLVLGAVVEGESGFVTLTLPSPVGLDECGFLCVQGTFVTCVNYPGQQFPGCVCACGPRDGQGCVVHGPDTPDAACAN